MISLKAWPEALQSSTIKFCICLRFKGYIYPQQSEMMINAASYSAPSVCPLLTA